MGFIFSENDTYCGVQILLPIVAMVQVLALLCFKVMFENIFNMLNPYE